MQTLWEAYLDQHARPKKKASSVEQDERLWRLHLAPRFADQKIEAVSLATIRKFHADMKGTPGSANRALALLSKMMSFAVDNEWRSDNPCPRVQRYPERKMERYLTDSETKKLWTVLDADEDQCAATIIKVLLLTGARRNEVLTMQWSDLDLAPTAAKWTLRAGRQKGERAVHRDMVRPLDPLVADLLLAWKRSQTVPSLRWVFPSERKLGSHRTCFKYAWKRIRKAAGIEDVRVHDLRHSFASFAVNSGASLEAIGAALGHKDVRTTQRYAHLTDRTVRAVVNAVSARISDR
ncbi:tyrosine-type recombinase/integrase [Maricaulis sp.]|uniref:tyrosine-type recombinase/integrase n=1 Tax=Maricaulis sp. TaxID=1486257 RepID=UPI003A94952D